MSLISDPVFAVNQALRKRLSDLLRRDLHEPVRDRGAGFAFTSTAGVVCDPNLSLNVIVTGNEVSNQHGTGPLVKRVCQGWPNVLSIRARNDWGGVQDFGDWHVCPSPRPTTRVDFFRNVVSLLQGRKVETVLCVPYLTDEFYTSIALHECFGAKLCVYLMDDQNVAANEIPDRLMREFLERCSLRVATHPELQHMYERKYRLPFCVLPAVVPAGLVQSECWVGAPETSNGALIGSFWDQSWFDRLCSVLSRCNRSIDWFGNNKSPWFEFSQKNLRMAGIKAHGIVPEDRLATELRRYPFVIVPVGALDDREANTGVAHLSLPGRILFAVATANIPVLIVGSPRTCGARFVRHFGVGEVVPYDADAVSAAMDRISEPEAQVSMRAAAARIAPMLSDRGVSEWLRDSIQLGVPADCRFGDLFSGYNAALEVDPKSAMAVCGK